MVQCARIRFGLYREQQRRYGEQAADAQQAGTLSAQDSLLDQLIYITARSSVCEWSMIISPITSCAFIIRSRFRG
jgi:hypothetical protein